MQEFIYLVSGCVDYEGKTPIRAFNTEVGAMEFKAGVEAYDKNKPASPPTSAYEKTEESDRIWKEFDKALISWLSSHPLAPGDCDWHGYDCDSIPFTR